MTRISLGASARPDTPSLSGVHVDADGSEPGHSAMLTFRVPNESENDSLTTQLTVTVPPNTAAMAEHMPGWKIALDRDVAAGTVRSVTWTAAPGAGIAPDEFVPFRVSLTLPKSDTVSFPATQTYSDGSVVQWDQAPLPEGGEPDHPAPMLTLAAEASSSHADDTARWLAVAGLVVGAVAVALALVRRRA